MRATRRLLEMTNEGVNLPCIQLCDADELLDPLNADPQVCIMLASDFHKIVSELQK
jgi:hypothetical protein